MKLLLKQIIINLFYVTIGCLFVCQLFMTTFCFVGTAHPLLYTIISCVLLVIEFTIIKHYKLFDV